LRKKLEPVPSAPRYLATEPWIGYRFNPSGESIRRRGYESVLGVLASSTP